MFIYSQSVKNQLIRDLSPEFYTSIIDSCYDGNHLEQYSKLTFWNAVSIYCFL